MKEHIQIIEALASGKDPLTGEVFAHNSPYQHPHVIRALHYALQQLKKGNKGNKWSPHEDQQLTELFHNGAKTLQIAAALERSPGAVRSRILKLGLTRKT